MTLGEKIRDLRTKNSMTMDDLARLLGVQRSAVNKYEKGIVTNLKRSTIADLSRIFHVSPSYFLEDDESYTVSSDEYEIILAYRRSDAGIKSSVRKLLDIPEGKSIPESAIS